VALTPCRLQPHQRPTHLYSAAALLLQLLTWLLFLLLLLPTPPLLLLAADACVEVRPLGSSSFGNSGSKGRRCCGSSSSSGCSGGSGGWKPGGGGLKNDANPAVKGPVVWCPQSGMASLGEAFLGEGNVAGKNMLKLCARGSAIISEMLRLSENIPSAFQMHEKDARYAQVLLDYQFFKNEAHYDSRISADQALIELDDEVKENNLGLIVRFYNMFESIHKFVMDLLRYLGDVEEGVYVSHTLDRILLDVDGKQLMSEALYLYGMMLWLLDLRIDGQVRARGLCLTSDRGLTSRAGPRAPDCCILPLQEHGQRELHGGQEPVWQHGIQTPRPVRQEQGTHSTQELSRKLFWPHSAAQKIRRERARPSAQRRRVPVHSVLAVQRAPLQRTREPGVHDCHNFIFCSRHSPQARHHYARGR
jgi:hypothetical protein